MRLRFLFKIDGQTKGNHNYVLANGDEQRLEEIGAWLWQYMRQAMREGKDLTFTVEATTQAKYVC